MTLGALERIRGVKRSGDRIGNWLEIRQVEMLLDQAGNARDKALIACMVGCGLRRAEVCALDWEQWQQRGGRWIWTDIRGKGQRVRSIPAPEWVAEYMEAYRAGATVGRVYEIGPDTAYLIVRDTARKAGLGPLAPHDLRRTCARLMRTEGAPLEQVQAILGHASIQTTMAYVGSSLELRAGRAATDMIVLPGRGHGKG
jgi:integrase/recombinase XerD